ncbi:DUF5329 family protein [Dongia sp.]|uniref:DUF5329 family protein n=1 Tax=Dongia sp. TaxID=1977262 RepID=UPI003751645A
MRMIAAVLMLLVFAMPTARADPLADEIAHLVGFVRHSSCTFIRNGSEYSGAEAAEHIQAKYDYFKNEIASVEDFIARAASKSLMSGKPYQVRCEGQTIPAADWIRAEDARYRARQN